MTSVVAQAPYRQIYLIGNTADDSKKNAALLDLLDRIQNDQVPSDVLVLGDLIKERDTSRTLSSATKKKLDQQWQPFLDSRASLYFIGGDRDWNFSKRNGRYKVDDLEKYIQKKLGFKKAFIPSDGCPGPKVVELDDNTVLVGIQSQWLIHPHERPEAPETECKIMTEFDFWEEVKDELEEYNDKNVILAAHHPLISNGRYGGRRMGKYHLLPVVGTFMNSFHQQIGTPADLAYPAYEDYSFHLKRILEEQSGIVFVAGHERALEVNKLGENIHINSGALGNTSSLANDDRQLYKQSRKGYMRLQLFDNGDIRVQAYRWNGKTYQTRTDQPILQSTCASDKQVDLLINRRLINCRTTEQKEPLGFQLTERYGTSIAGPEYKTNRFRQWSMGRHYRSEWTKPIVAPYLDIGQEKGGLTPVEIGGGLQTYSLKFKAPDGRMYAFRSVNKDPVKALDDLARQTVYRHIVKDLITTQHPYGGLVASSLLDRTDILHPRPKLVLMPDDPRLGMFREKFKGRLGTLEIRPQSKKKNRASFEDADEVYSSPKLFRALYKDNDNQMDPQAYARARVFDMWIGDWDRHEDNWKWAGFKKGKKMTFKPIPRDRDHVFSQWEGLVPGLADKVVPNAEHFDYKFKNLYHLNFKARYLDRQLGNSLTLDDWLAAVAYIQEKMTDEAIEEAILQIPEAVRAYHGDEIAAKLRSRRLDLPRAARGLYKMLAKEVDVIGSNKREIFDVVRQTNGDVKVSVYDRSKKTDGRGDLFYERTFKRSETNEIRLFGLGNDDDFFLSGSSVEPAMIVRVIGGQGNDQIIDKTRASDDSAIQNFYYDSRRLDRILTSDSSRILRPRQIARYDNKAFVTNGIAPIPKFRVSSGNGFGLELLLTYTKHGFNKPGFHKKYQAKVIYYPGLRAHRLDLKSWYRHAVGLFDLNLHLRSSSLYDKYPFFYGIGNNSMRDERLLNDDYYRIDYNTIQFTTALERKFLQQSNFRTGVKLEYNTIQSIDPNFSILKEDPENAVNGFGKYYLLGWLTSLDLDFRDHPMFTRDGSYLSLEHELYTRVVKQEGTFGRINLNISHYETFKIGLPLTFAVRGGFTSVYGKAPFYYLAPLGSNAYLRTYVRNRFVGDRSLYFNSEMRLHLGNLRTPITPIKFGILGFYDLGRVWPDGGFDDWHRGVGGGFYAAPFSDLFNIIFVGGKNKSGDFYFSISTGFDLQ